MFVFVAIGAPIGMSTISTADASELHRSNGVNSRTNPVGGGLQSRAWGTVVGQNGASFRVRHYRRHANGGTTLINESNWMNTNGGTARTEWANHASAGTVSVLANVSTW